MNEKQFNFECEDKLTPFDLLERRLKEIEVATKGYVIGKIEHYEGPIDSYYKKTGFSTTLKVFSDNEEKIDIQNSLGDISDAPENRYEIFLSAKKIDKYKYRIMFLEYGELAYPAKLVLNKPIADAVIHSYSYVQIIKTMNQLVDIIENIYSSEYFINILQDVINESIRRETYDN